MTYKYLTSKYGDSVPTITRVEIEKEQGFYFWINGVKREKVSMYEEFHDSHEEAFSSLEDKYTSELMDAEAKLGRAEDNLEKMLKLKNQTYPQKV